MTEKGTNQTIRKADALAALDANLRKSASFAGYAELDQAARQLVEATFDGGELASPRKIRNMTAVMQIAITGLMAALNTAHSAGDITEEEYCGEM